MTSFAVKFPRVASYGHTVSHAKNRRNRAFKYNLCTVTLKDEKTGRKIKMRVPAKFRRTLKKQQPKKNKSA
jgi:ribosomal protein L28